MFVGESDLAEPGIQGEPLNALYGLTYLAWIATLVHVVFDERPHYAHCEARLRDTDGVALGWDGIEVTQPALEHVKRVQHIDRDAIRQGDFRCTLAHVVGVEADDPGEEVDLLDAVAGHLRINLRYLSADVVERALAQLPGLAERSLQSLGDVARTDEVGVRGHHTGEFADRLDAVVHGPDSECLSAHEQGVRSAHSQDPLNLIGRELGFLLGAGRVSHTRLALGQRTLAPRRRSGRSSSIWPFETSAELAMR